MDCSTPKGVDEKYTLSCIVFPCVMLQFYERIFLSMGFLIALYIEDMMEFKNEELIEREIEIAAYLLQDFSLNQIAETTGISKKLLMVHIRNMMEKLKAENMLTLIKFLKEKLNLP